MNLNELQESARAERERLWKHYKVEDERVRALAHMTKVTEEVGELGEEVLMQLGLQRKKKLDGRAQGNIEKEFADVIYTTAILADTLGVDLDKVMTARIAEIKERDYEE